VLELPQPATASDLISLLELAAAVLQVGRSEQVFDVVETPRPEGFLAERDGPYEEFLARGLAETGRLKLLDLPRGGVATTPDGTLRTPALVQFEVPGGAVQEAVVHDVGALLRELEPDTEAGYQRWLMAHVPPVAVHGGTVTVDGDGPSPRLTVELPTSLWFPRVHDPRADEPSWSPNPAGPHNAARLNRFLSAVRAAGEAVGGSWRVADPTDVDTAYAEQVGEDGIRLPTIDLAVR
jgi:hypothetical protein